jgi:hypothetical protein
MATFNIMSNTTWTLSADQPWLKLSKVSGSDNSSIEVSASANTENESRSGSVTVTGLDVTSKTVKVVQDGTKTKDKISILNDSDISIYPMPVTSKLYISISKPVYNSTIELFSQDRKKLYSVSVNALLMEIDMSKFTRGIYVVKISASDNSSVIKKVIKQ